MKIRNIETSISNGFMHFYLLSEKNVLKKNILNIWLIYFSVLFWMQLAVTCEFLKAIENKIAAKKITAKQNLTN